MRTSKGLWCWCVVVSAKGTQSRFSFVIDDGTVVSKHRGEGGQDYFQATGPGFLRRYGFPPATKGRRNMPFRVGSFFRFPVRYPGRAGRIADAEMVVAAHQQGTNVRRDSRTYVEVDGMFCEKELHVTYRPCGNNHKTRMDNVSMSTSSSSRNSRRFVAEDVTVLDRGKTRTTQLRKKRLRQRRVRRRRRRRAA